MKMFVRGRFKQIRQKLHLIDFTSLLILNQSHQVSKVKPGIEITGYKNEIFGQRV